MRNTSIWTVVDFENLQTGKKHQATLAGRYNRREIVIKIKKLFGIGNVSLGTIYSTSDFKYESPIKPSKRTRGRRNYE